MPDLHQNQDRSDDSAVDKENGEFFEMAIIHDENMKKKNITNNVFLKNLIEGVPMFESTVDNSKFNIVVFKMKKEKWENSPMFKSIIEQVENSDEFGNSLY